MSGLILSLTYMYVTGPVTTNHVSANYTSYIFANIFCSECNIPFLRRRPIKFCSSDKVFVA